MAERPLFDPQRVRPAEEDGAAPRPAALTVTPSRVNEMVRGAVNRHVPATLHVLGEIGDLSRASSGHVYLTLKDAQSELRCVLWRSAATKLKFQPAVGMEVIATGGIEVYAPRGTYQLIARSLEPRGVGALELAFRQLCDKLEKEGLFDPRRKKPIPPYPRRIGLITSPVGAAVRDIVQTMQRRAPGIEILVAPVRVQGDGAADEIARAVRLMNAHADRLGGIDVLIVSRGGGSLEDLWAFNEEVVARAVAGSHIPVVSGVGHEVDVTICDLVADLRAATPTAAAELVTPNRADLLTRLDLMARRAGRAAAHAVEIGRHRLHRIASQAPFARPLGRVQESSQRLDECGRRLALALAHRLHRRHAHLARAATVVSRFGAGAEFVRLGGRLERALHRLDLAWLRRATEQRRATLVLDSRIAAAGPVDRVGRANERLRDLLNRAERAIIQRIAAARERLESRRAAIEACHPRRVLARGFSITRDARTGRVIHSVHEVTPDQRLAIELGDGVVPATADDPRQPRLFP